MMTSSSANQSAYQASCIHNQPRSWFTSFTKGLPRNLSADCIENTALIENKMNRKLENHDLVGKRRTNKRVVSFWSEEATLFSREYFHRMRCSSQRWEFNINIGDVFGRCFMNSACKKALALLVCSLPQELLEKLYRFDTGERGIFRIFWGIGGPTVGQVPASYWFSGNL